MEKMLTMPPPANATRPKIKKIRGRPDEAIFAATILGPMIDAMRSHAVAVLVPNARMRVGYSSGV